MSRRAHDHQRREQKRARRAKRIAASRGGGRGPITRALGRAELARVGEHRILAMVASVPRAERKPRQPAPLRLVATAYGTLCRPELREGLERDYAERAA